jgi:uncharacterized repeat protein (TIGR01451 family)
MYASQIKRDSSLKLDKNGSNISSETSFQGAGHIGVLKKASPGSSPKEALAYESQENYLGSFKVISNVDEYGQNVAADRSVNGSGMVSSDRRIGKSQRSYESGTGAYQSEERTQTLSNYMSKEINVNHSSMRYTYTPDFKVNISKKWKEGMWSKSGSYNPKGSSDSSPASYIGEEYSNIDYLKKSTKAKGLNQMDTEAEFSGKAAYTAVKSSSANGTGNELAMYEEYLGKYKVSKKTSLGGVARYERPHLNVTKVGKAEPFGGSNVDYVITVTNDGNRTLGPVYVTDLFPLGTKYVYSSARPSELTENSATWTLLTLGTGATIQIDLKLNITRDADSLINRVQARGGYNDQWVVAQNFSAINLGWLSCCPSQLLAAKEAQIDSEDPTLVHYEIILKNREKSMMVASVVDQMPTGMVFQNASVLPDEQKSGHMTWNIIHLEPGNVRIIDYWAKAMHSGTFVNLAHVEAHYLNGTEAALADLSSSVDIGGNSQLTSSSDWKPPNCFGLNCSEQEHGSDWMACSNCGAIEPQPLSSVCSSCSTSAGTGEGYDVP